MGSLFICEKEMEVLANVYNKYKTAEKYEKVNPYNKMMLDDFLLSLKAEGRKDGTINMYKANIKVLFIYILDNLNNIPISELKAKQYRNFILWLQDKDLSVARINNIKSASSSMLNYASNDNDYEDDIPINQIKKLKPLNKEPRREIIFLTDEQITKVRQELINRKKYQIALLLSLMYDSGARRNECYQIMKDDITIGGHMTKRKVIGKRGKKFHIYYHDWTTECYELYMNERGKDDIEELWLTRSGKPASYETLYTWITYCRKVLKELEGESAEFNPHSFRHAFATNMTNGTHYLCKKLNRKFSLEEIQILLNHSSIETTNSYIKSRDEEIIAEAFGWSN